MRHKHGLEPCQSHMQAQRKRQSYIQLSRGRMGTPGCVNKRAGGKRVVVDSAAGMHMVSRKDLTANDEVLTKDEATVCVKELDQFVTVMHLEETPAVLSLGKRLKQHLAQNGKIINCNVANCVPFVVYHSLSLVCRRVPLLHLYLLRQHLHRRML